MLTVALPRGKSLEQRTLELFRQARITVRREGDSIDFPGPAELSEGSFIKPKRIPLLVAEGDFDIGITGEDVILESGAHVEVCARLNYSRSTDEHTRNARIKQREPFRPFAPVVLAEHAAEFFEIDQTDPFMTMAPRVRTDKAHLIPAAVHVDGTARIQTVDRPANPRYYRLIEEFARRTGILIILNTSFNHREPIVASPADAVACYLRTGMDLLVLGDFVAVRPALGGIGENIKEYATA